MSKLKHKDHDTTPMHMRTGPSKNIYGRVGAGLPSEARQVSKGSMIVLHTSENKKHRRNKLNYGLVSWKKDITFSYYFVNQCTKQLYHMPRKMILLPVITWSMYAWKKDITFSHYLGNVQNNFLTLV